MDWANGHKEWWVNGKRHRMDGPAVEWANGDKEWYFRNKKVSKRQMKTQVSKLQLKILLLSRVVNPFCEINVARYVW
jgi:hypothetical protein